MHVYLDTNVIIRGAKDPEHIRLKILARDGLITLYTSPTCSHEHEQRSTTLNQKPLPEDPTEAVKAITHMEALETAEDAELEWWHPVALKYPKCTFEGLILCPQVAVALGDPTGELACLSELLEVHGLRQTDAIHLMIAHSAKLDGLLTWDSEFVKKAGRIPWLIPRVETPADFLTRTGLR